MKRFATNTLNFTINPGTVFISTDPDQSSYTNITVSIENAGAAALNVKSIAITLPAQLAPSGSLSSIIPVAGQPNLWNFGPSQNNAGEFDAESQSVNGEVINPGDVWQFNLQMVTLVSTITVPAATVTVGVFLKDGSSIPASLNINIDAATQSIISFNSEPSDINPGESATLSWQCEEMQYCVISPIDDSHRSESGSLTVQPDSSTIYTLYAFGDGVILSAQWAISVKNPMIITFGGIGGQSGVDYNNNITLIWTCNQFTNSVSMVSDAGITIPPLDTGSNTPQQGSISVGPLIKKTTFTLTAYGSNKQDFIKSSTPINMNNLTANLTATPDSGLWQKDLVTLKWSIESAVSVTLSPSIPNGPSLQNLVGSADVHPEQDITYVLAVTGFNGNSLFSENIPVPLKVTPVSIIDFSVIPPIISPDISPNQAELSWATQAQTASLSGVGTVNTTDTLMLTAPADGSTYTLSAGTFQNPALVTQTVQVGSLCGPYNFNLMAPSPMQGLEVEIQNPAQLSYLAPKATYNVALTGVVVSGGTPPTNYVGTFLLIEGVLAFFSLLNQPPLTYDWADPNNKTGTITLSSSTTPVGPITFNFLEGGSYQGSPNIYFLGITAPAFAHEKLVYCVQLTGVTISGGTPTPYNYGCFFNYNGTVVFILMLPPGLTAAWTDPSKQTGTVTFLGITNAEPAVALQQELLNNHVLENEHGNMKFIRLR